MGILTWRTSRIVLGANVIFPALWSVAGADEFRKQPGKNWSAPVPFVNWTGFYVGGHTGYARGAASDRVADPFPTGKALGAMFGGVQIGYNQLLPSGLLLGVEGDLSFPNFLSADDVVRSRYSAQGLLAEKIDYVGRLRGRIGYAFDDWLVDGTGWLCLVRCPFHRDQ